MESIQPAAITAATLLATKALEALGTKAGETTWAGMGRLAAMVRTKVRGHQRAENALAGIEQVPESPDGIRVLGEVLATFASQDRAFRRELSALVTQARRDPVIGPLASQVYHQAEIGQVVTIGQMRDLHIYPAVPAAPSPLLHVSARFVQAYEWHGIHPAEIPDFLEQTGGPHVNLSDLSSKERLLERLDSSLLDFTTEIFRLNGHWLRQETAPKVLTSHDFYKNVESLADFLLVQSVYRSSRRDLWGLPTLGVRGIIYFFSTDRPSVENFNSQDIHVGAIYRVPIIEFRGRTVCRYFPLKALPWNYWRSHFQLVAMMAIADECEIMVLGRLLSSTEDVFDLCDGRRFPVELTGSRDGSRETWSPEYPYFGASAQSEEEWYQRKWSRYLGYLEQEGYEETIQRAKEERWKAWFGKAE